MMSSRPNTDRRPGRPAGDAQTSGPGGQHYTAAELRADLDELLGPPRSRYADELAELEALIVAARQDLAELDRALYGEVPS